MVDLWKLGLDDLSVTAQPQPCRGVKLESRIEFKIARGPHDPVIVDLRRSEAGDELREAARRKSQHRRQRSLDIAKTRIVVRAGRHSHRFDRLFREDMTRG